MREGQLDSRAPPGRPRLRLGEGLLVWVGGHPLSGVRAAALGSCERAVVCGTHPGPGSSSIAVHTTLCSAQMASAGATLTPGTGELSSGQVSLLSVVQLRVFRDHPGLSG